MTSETSFSVILTTGNISHKDKPRFVICTSMSFHLSLSRSFEHVNKYLLCLNVPRGRSRSSASTGSSNHRYLPPSPPAFCPCTYTLPLKPFSHSLPLPPPSPLLWGPVECGVTTAVCSESHQDVPPQCASVCLKWTSPPTSFPPPGVPPQSMKLWRSSLTFPELSVQLFPVLLA